MQNSKIIVASGSVIVEENKVLLIREGKGNDWKFVGGKAEFEHENLEQVARREAREEMGINLEIIDSEPYFYHVTRPAEGGQIDFLLFHYRAHRIGELKPGQEIREWCWMDLSVINNSLQSGNVRELGLSPNIVPALRYYNFIE
ncbi:NUDIX hydrolase [Candidatus Falkowbacteria bacterium]|nr:NUDIX hydrolase [Candidatus Falkowbacteria bacterium]